MVGQRIVVFFRPSQKKLFMKLNLEHGRIIFVLVFVDLKIGLGLVLGGQGHLFEHKDVYETGGLSLCLGLNKNAIGRGKK